MTAPSACLASLPVSIEIVRLPIVTSRFCVVGIMGTWKLWGNPVQSRRGPRRSTPEPSLWEWLLPDTQSANQIRVPVGILPLEVVEQPPALADELEQTAAGMMILRVGLEMFGEIVDPIAQDGDLDFRGAGVRLMRAIAADDVGLAFVAHVMSSTDGPERARSA